MTNQERTHIILERMQDLQPSFIELQDESPGHVGHAGNTGAGYFHLTIVSAMFEGKSRIDRHRMVMNLVNDLIPSEIHAFRITARSSQERSQQGQRP